MRKQIKFLVSLFLAFLTLTAFSQNDVAVTVYYMKVKPGESEEYLELEQEWKKINQARIDQGYITGWQLWQKMYSGADDEYQYIVLEWYENFQKTATTGYLEVINDLYSQEQLADLSERTHHARVVTRTDVMHRISTVENSKPTSFLIVGEIKPRPGMEEGYLKMEREIFLPLHQEAVNQGQMTTWSLWRRWPYKENDAPYAVVNGFDDFTKIGKMDYPELFKAVDTDMTIEEVWNSVGEIRDITKTEVWRLVDSIFPGGDHE